MIFKLRVVTVRLCFIFRPISSTVLNWTIYPLISHFLASRDTFCPVYVLEKVSKLESFKSQ